MSVEVYRVYLLLGKGRVIFILVFVFGKIAVFFIVKILNGLLFESLD